MARPRVADGGTAYRYGAQLAKYVELAVADSRQGVVLQLGGLGQVLTNHHLKN